MTPVWQAVGDGPGMDYNSRTRDRFRWTTIGVSGVLTSGVLVGTGAIAGQMAADQRADDATHQRQQAQQQAAWQAEQAAYQAVITRLDATPQVVLKQRPKKTRVVTHYVTSTSGGVTIAAASGGSATAGSRSHSAPAPASHPAPPPPPRPTSSGS